MLCKFDMYMLISSCIFNDMSDMAIINISILLYNIIYFEWL